MLSNATYHTTLPCSDINRAKQWYSEKLGLTPVEEQAGGSFYEGRNGTRFLLFPSSGTASGTHTQMGFRVDDINSEIRELKSRGVQFEEYDFEGFDKATSTATFNGITSAWFKDSEGNLVGIAQLP